MLRNTSRTSCRLCAHFEVPAASCFALAELATERWLTRIVERRVRFQCLLVGAHRRILGARSFGNQHSTVPEARTFIRARPASKESVDNWPLAITISDALGGTPVYR